MGRHTGALLDRGLGPLLDGHRVVDLGRMYGLLGRVGASDALRQAFREYLRATGLALVKDEEKVGEAGKGGSEGTGERDTPPGAWRCRRGLGSTTTRGPQAGRGDGRKGGQRERNGQVGRGIKGCTSKWSKNLRTRGQEGIKRG